MFEDIYVGNSTESMTSEWVRGLDLPTTMRKTGSDAMLINDDIYIISGTQLYKYDTINETFTLLGSAPFSLGFGSACAINEDIYFFIPNTSSKYVEVYKYNTLSGDYTKLPNSSVYMDRGDVVAIGTDIYILVGYGGSTHKEIYKFNTIDGTYAFVGSSISYLYGVYAIAINNDLYIQDTKKLYKFNVISGECTEVGTHPKTDVNTPPIANVDNNIFIFGGYSSSTYRAYLYKFNIIDETYTQLENMPYAGKEMVTVSDGYNIYLFGGDPSAISQYLYKYKTHFTYVPGIYLYLNTTTYKDLGGWLLSEMYKNITKIQIFNESEKLDYEAYIGDGTSWNLFNGES